MIATWKMPQMRQPATAGAPHVGGPPVGNPNHHNPNPLPEGTTCTTTHLTDTPQPNQHRVNDTNNNPMPPEPNIDTFYKSWGDNMQPTKQTQTMHLVLQNFGRWLQWNNN